MEKIKTLYSRHVYTGRVFTVRNDRVELPGGRVTSLDVVQHGGAVVIVPIMADGRYVMIRQYRHAAQKTLLEFPAGTLEEGEDPADCAQRELREETGFAADTFQRLGGFYLAPGYSTEYLHIYIARGLSESPLPADEDEMVTVEIVTPDDLQGSIAAGELQDAKSLAALQLLAIAG